MNIATFLWRIKILKKIDKSHYLTNFYVSGWKLKLNAEILRTKYFAHHFGGYDVINECTLFMHLVKLTKFTLGPIARKVKIGYTQPWYQIKSHKCVTFVIHHQVTPLDSVSKVACDHWS